MIAVRRSYSVEPCEHEQYMNAQQHTNGGHQQKKTRSHRAGQTAAADLVQPCLSHGSGHKNRRFRLRPRPLKMPPAELWDARAREVASARLHRRTNVRHAHSHHVSAAGTQPCGMARRWVRPRATCSCGHCVTSVHESATSITGSQWYEPTGSRILQRGIRPW